MIRLRLYIKGQVQGVGFRPFVYNLAKKLDLIGYVKNSNFGVEIEIEGEKDNLDRFKISLYNDLPPLAKIDSIECKDIKPLYKGQFEIVKSIDNSKYKVALIPPDIATCNRCLDDIQNISKYSSYFATNCTNCGPRYTISQTVPYDRDNTSMKDFCLCKSCKKEYNKPTNRRYHAQPTSCRFCGPKLALYGGDISIDNSDIYKQVAKLIKAKKIGAIKGIGGFYLVCDATCDEVVKKLREYKNRPTKPFAIMCKDIKMLSKYAIINKQEIKLLKSKEAPIVLLKKRDQMEYVAPNIDRIGAILAYSAFYHLLFNYLDNPIVATSANLGGEPIIIDRENIEKKLPFVDFIVDYNRDIINAIDDTVLKVINNDIFTIRLARGYTPKEIKLPFKLDKKILALGANQKNSIAFAFDDKIVLSPYIGDLDTIESVEYLKRVIETFKRFYNFEPDIVLCDKHNGYESTKLAKTFDKPIIQVWHHLAHLYSVKAQYNLTKDYTSFIFDGSGLGEDGRLWGGEVFVKDKREYSFKTIKLLGGTKAIKEPKRVALSMLFDRYSLDKIQNLDLPTLKEFSKNEIKILHNSWSKDINTPKSSSVGRYFDAIASLSGVCQVQTYEGEAGLLSEQNFIYKHESFDYEIVDGIIDIKFDFFDKDLIAKFYTTLVNIITKIALKRDLPVILSGGVWQNSRLLKLATKALDKHKIKYYYNTTTPINDGGIALGQIWSFVNR